MFAKKTPLPPPPGAAFIGESVITVGRGVAAGAAAAVQTATEGATADDISAADDVGAITAEAITGSVLTY